MRKLLTVAAVLALMLTLSAVPASADTLQIQFNGLNLVYSSSTGILQTAGCANTGSGCVANDALIDADFVVNGVLVGTSTTSSTAMTLVVGALPVSGTVSGAGSGYPSHYWDFCFNGACTQFLLTDSSGWSITTSSTGITFTVGGTLASSIFAQALPFGLVFNNPNVTISFSSSILSGSSSSGFWTSFSSAGTGEVVGSVPEPGTLALFGAALLGLAGLRRKLS